MASKVSIFFDLDGTLCDPREGIIRCFSHALDALGQARPPEDELARYIGPPLHESFAALLNSGDIALIRRAVELYRQRFVTQGMFENAVYAGMEDALAALQPHVRLYVVTSKPTVFALQILEHFGLERFFRLTYGSELDGTRSDKKKLIAHVLAEENIPSSEAVMVGDREHDVKGALKNSVLPIGVLWGYGSHEELTQAGASVLCDSPMTLVELLLSGIPQAQPCQGRAS
ncbi:MAG: HAD-IA family hydrolase [Candidatus Binatia bacterium]